MLALQTVLLLASSLCVAVRCSTAVNDPLTPGDGRKTYITKTAARMHSAALKACSVPTTMSYLDCSDVISAFLPGGQGRPIQIAGRCDGSTSSQREPSEQLVVRRVAATAEFYRDVYDFIHRMERVVKPNGDIHRWNDAYESVITGVPPEYALRMPFEQVKQLDALQRAAMLRQLPLDEIVRHGNTLLESGWDCGPRTFQFSEELAALQIGVRLLKKSAGAGGAGVAM